MAREEIGLYGMLTALGNLSAEVRPMGAMRRAPRLRRGSAFLALLAVLVIIGLLALRLIPDMTTVEQRRKEGDLSLALTEMRTAIRLERLASGSDLGFYADWDDPSSFSRYLDNLVSRGYLRKVPTDPMTPVWTWGTASNQLYWRPVRNLVASASFESSMLRYTAWATGSQKVVAMITPQAWVGASDTRFDAFPGENLFGSVMASGGHALLIVAP